MAGRGGRGRGRGMSFNVESLGFGRGETLPGPILQPPPAFPLLEFKPVPLSTGEEIEYLLVLKQDFRSVQQTSPDFLKASDKKKDITRYSDKYQMNGNNGQHSGANYNWAVKNLPAELFPKTRKVKRLKSTGSAKVNVRPRVALKDVVKQLEALEKREGGEPEEEEEEEEEQPGKKKKEGEEEEEPQNEEEYYDDDDLEEETDYNVTYFDNGEGFGADEEEDLDEGPTY